MLPVLGPTVALTVMSATTTSRENTAFFIYEREFMLAQIAESWVIVTPRRPSINCVIPHIEKLWITATLFSYTSLSDLQS